MKCSWIGDMRDGYIFGRAFLGLGAAGLLQGALGIISHIVPLEKVPMYQGFVAGSAAVSATAGPVIGGALTDSVGWSEFNELCYKMEMR
jgi:MFS family permease